MPRAKTLVVPLPGDVVAGDDVSVRPRDSQFLDHEPPVYDL